MAGRSVPKPKERMPNGFGKGVIAILVNQNHPCNRLPISPVQETPASSSLANEMLNGLSIIVKSVPVSTRQTFYKPLSTFVNFYELYELERALPLFHLTKAVSIALIEFSLIPFFLAKLTQLREMISLAFSRKSFASSFPKKNIGDTSIR